MHLNKKTEFQTVLALDRKSFDRNDQDQALRPRKTQPLFSLKPLDATNENRDFFLLSDFQQA